MDRFHHRGVAHRIIIGVDDRTGPGPASSHGPRVRAAGSGAGTARAGRPSRLTSIHMGACLADGCLQGRQGRGVARVAGRQRVARLALQDRLWLTAGGQ
jgi:hypothetical protein